ncbi:hypothetical protein BX070DRAFT_228669 [Coemansia spiralis]|nr:hypothetical protein BX070DRAFT_228669 [Coemansia spiralis]
MPENEGKRKNASASSNRSDIIELKGEGILCEATDNNVRMYRVRLTEFPDGPALWQTEEQLNRPDFVQKYKETRIPSTADLSKFHILLGDVKGEFIDVRNEVDDVGCPENFTYINSSIYSEDVPRPCTPILLCECIDDCISNCPCVHEKCYDSNGRVSAPINAPLMECSSKCQCGKNCKTKVVQKGTTVGFEIRRFNLKGWGVVTKRDIPRGTFIAEYVGEIISFEEAERRGIEDTAVGLTYLFDMDMACGYTESADFSVDAKTHGNVTHFFNHSCSPSMEIRPVYIEHRDPRLHRLAFFSTRNIRAGEELTFDYSPSYNFNESTIADLQRLDGSVKFACYCRDKRCRNYIYF